VLVAGLVVEEVPALCGLGDVGRGDRRVGAREIGGQLQHGVEAPGVATGGGHELRGDLGIDRHVEGAEAALAIGDRALGETREMLVGQRLEPDHARARQQRGDDAEARVLGGGPDQRDGAGLDVGEQGVLLGLAEPVDLVDEQQRPRAELVAPLGRLRDRLADVLHAGLHRGQRDQLGPDQLPEQARERRLPAAGRAPQDE